MASAPTLSVVIPTYNEAANIQPLLAALDDALAGVDREYVVVDDDSRDGTAKAAAAHPKARVIVRKAERGLATAVVRGMKEAAGEYVAVMDADFQHPPQAVRALLDRARSTGADLVVGSRYARGGSDGGFGAARRVISKGARGISKALLPPIRRFHLTDPMSGLFLVRRDHVDPDSLRPQGYKILLEILGRANLRRVEEVGYRFQDRRGGESKLGASVILQYLAHVLALGMQHPENQRLMRFMLVGASGTLVTTSLVFVLHELLGLEVSLALILSIEAAILTNFLLNDRFTFKDRRDVPFLLRLGMFNLVSLGGLAVNFATFFVLHYFVGLHYLLAVVIAIAVAFVVNYLGNLGFTYGGAKRPTPSQWVPILVLVALSGSLYATGLDNPDSVYFDESYYLAVAYQMENGVWNDPCWDHDARGPLPLNYEHPPLAKLLLYASIHAYDEYHGVFLGCRSPNDQNDVRSEPCYTPGDGAIDPEGRTKGPDCFNAWTSDMKAKGNPYAWRGPAALFGVFTVTFGALAARRLFRSDLAGGLAGALILADTLVLSSSRIALLDIFAVGFSVMALWAATHPTKRGVIGTFVFLGLGFACKYYVLFVGPPILLVSLWVHARHGRLTRSRFDLHWISSLTIPPAIWIATYTPWWILWTQTKGFGYAVGTFIKSTGMAIKWDAFGGDQGHQYQSKPSEWLSMSTPMSYIGPANPTSETIGSYIYAVGNPFLWWAATLAILYAVIDYLTEYVGSWRRRFSNPLSYFASMPRIRQAILVTALVPLAAYGGFFLLQRTTFIFYMTLVVPFFAVVLAGALTYMWSTGNRLVRAAFLLVCAAVAFGFLWYLQVSIYMPIPRNGFAWLPWPGTPFYYPAIGFNDVMRLLPWMQQYGNQACWKGDLGLDACP